MKNSKKVFAMLLALVMVFSMMSMSAVASETDNLVNPVSTSNNLTLRMGDPNYPNTPPECYMSFDQDDETNTYDVTYHGPDSDYPGYLALFITSGASTITAMPTTGGVAVQPTTTDASGNQVPTTDLTTGFYIITISSTGTLAITNNDGTVTLNFTVTGSTATSDASIYAFLPAPGQFTNEGVTTGGWGDAYTSAGALKGNDSTGVSLGFFGGYVVYKYDRPILNDASNPYGADFIVYGNAFYNNSEPGCIQVSQDGSTWYDIAGSMHYDADTVWNASITYTNPAVSEDAGITAPGNNLGTMTAVPYVLNGASSSVTTNPFHRHSWWPLNANYFATVGSRVGLAKVDALPFVSQTTSSGVASTLTFTGTLLGGFAGTSGTPNYGFGYCDVHPNGTLGGSVAYNPYALPSTTVTDASSYTTFLATAGVGGSQASGGDPIDISWAVDGNGEPVNLTSIQYVRIYTGTAVMNGILGEVSTEVCGIAAAESASSSQGTTGFATISASAGAITDSLKQRNVLKQTNIAVGAGVNSTTLTISSSADHLLVKDSAVTGGSASVTVNRADGETQYFRVITQTGTKQASITVVKVTFA